ncbi:MAG: 16S rRNA (cytosine(967)-C(5))-methyltransferase RsmB [Oscillospiraceae bacterium]|nr:16S rRNA (cytosine(967)-C(5))-methyltransferase RsmB [Oscillospiraceae bacterium]MBR0393080.1 16S rRNA (cytosine(967)-C(5))-methyltransferase RsmB [Oscillospiraceae bacterium]
MLQVGKCSVKEDQKLAERIAYGVIQNERLLNALLSGFFTSKPHPQVLQIIQLSAFQLLFLDRVPHSAVVNDAVALCKEKGKSFASGFVNAVLRRISREKQQLLDSAKDYPPAVRFSHPDWLVSRLNAAFGPAFTEEFLQANQGQPSITLQVNTSKCGYSELLRLLQESEAVILASDEEQQSFHISGTDVTLLPGYREGFFFVQDGAAHISVRLAQIRENMKVLDVCAAPGGKSIVAALCGGEVLACDVSEKRMQRCRENFQRLGLPITCRVEDACCFYEDHEERFPVVIADVPCTGSGIIRKHPEIRNKKESDLLGLVELQKTILSNVARYVAPGGILLYSTCSVLPEEDELQIRSFLDTHPDYQLLPVSLPEYSCENGMLRSWPQLNGNDGFFAAVLKKT